MLNTLKNKKFQPLLATHIFGTLDDNLAKNIFVFLAAFFVEGSVYWLTSAFALYGLAFLLACLFAGAFVDKYQKSILIQKLKLLEIAVIVFTLGALHYESRVLMLISLIGFGFLSSASRIAKYSFLPELLSQNQWFSANALLKGFSFVSAIVAMLMLYGLHISTRAIVLYCMGGALFVSAVLGYLSSLKLPTTKEAVPNLEISKNPFPLLRETSLVVEENPSMRFCFSCIIWYWLLAGVIAFFARDFCKSVLQAHTSVLVLAMLVFFSGYALGAFISPIFIDKKKMTALIPISAFVLTFTFLDMLASAHVLPDTQTPYRITAFLTLSINSYRFLLDVFISAICSAFFIVPFYPMLQKITPKKMMGRVFASLSCCCGLALLGSVLIVFSLNLLQIPLIIVFLVLAILNIFFAFYSCQILSFETRQKILRKVLNLFFHVDFSGLENLKKAGKRVLIIPNHTSYLDALVISAFINQPITFALSDTMAKKWWVRFLGNLMRIKGVNTASALSIKAIVAELKAGNLCMIMTDAHLPGGNTQMKIYEAPALIAQKADAKILPVQLKGLEYSAYSRLPGKTWWKFFPQIQMSILPAESLKVGQKKTFNEARSQLSNRLYEILANMRLEASNIQQSLFEAVIHSMQRVGRNKPMMEDTDRKPVRFKQIFFKAFILGKLINRALPDEKTVGLMLPTSNACVLSLLGLQAYGKVPAMINFSSGPKQVISTCKTVCIHKVLTARKVVSLGKLEPLIEALTKEGIEVIYLEDLKKFLHKKDIFSAFIDSLFPLKAYRQYAGLIKPSDPAVILFTSGSEGLPKAVLLSHSNVLANAYQIITLFDVWDNDIMFNCLPIFHSFGLSVGTFMPLVLGFKMVLYPTPLHYRVIPGFCSSVRATILFATDTFLAGYAKCANNYDFNSLRIVAAGAEKLKDETRRMWVEKFGVRVVEGYGATECSPIIAANSFLRSKLGSVGCLLTGLEYQFKEVPGIKEGKELVVKGPNVMIGYMKHDKPGVLQPPKDGWYETGDIIHMDEEGFLFIKGRSKRFAKIAGEMVSLLAVETAISSAFKGFIHGVVSIPDAKKGEQLVLITTCSEITTEKLVGLFQEKGLPELSIPKKIIFTDTPPLMSTGKFDYPTATQMANKEINGQR